MTHTLHELRDVLAERPLDLLPPDLDSVRRDGLRLRRRRTTTRGLGGIAAALLLVAAVAGAVRLDDRGGGGVVATSEDVVARSADLARSAQVRVDSRMSALAGEAVLQRAAWSGTRPDGEQASRALPRDDREWATLQWLRFRADLAGGATLFVLTENQPASVAAPGPPVGAEDRACTHVYSSCTTTRLPHGVVAVERGRTDSGGQGLRASYTPDDPDGSWVLADVTTPTGDTAPYTADQLVDLVTDPAMSLPVPLSADELPGG